MLFENMKPCLDRCWKLYANDLRCIFVYHWVWLDWARFCFENEFVCLFLM